MSKGKKEKILVVCLVFVLAVVVVKQFVLSDESLTGSAAIGRAVTSKSAPVVPRALRRRSPQRRRPTAQTDPAESVRPLPLQALEATRQIGEEPARNIFVYYVPPPEPKIVEPAAPPPLMIRSIDPTSVYAGTNDFRLKVVGVDFPEGVQIFINGQPVPTTRTSESELTTTVEKQLIATPGQLNVAVKDSTGELYSNLRSLRVEAPPKPSYKFIGRIDDLVYLEKGQDERLVARVGDTVEKRWRVAKVGSESVVLEDVDIGIQHTIAIAEPAPIVGGRRLRRSLVDRFRFRRTVPRTNRRPRPQSPTNRKRRRNP